MKLNQLPKHVDRPKKRIGRGLGSGRGKTGGRGTKGQKARGKVSMDFSGGGLPLYKKIPFLRGHNNKPVSPKSVGISLSKLSQLKASSTVNLQTLIEKKIIKERHAKKGVKILDGDIAIPLNIDLPVSAKAKIKIIKAGGKLIKN